VFLATCLGAEWSVREDSDVTTHFSLLRVRSGPENLSGMSFDCFRKIYCSVDDEGGLCQAYEAMSTGGLFFLACEFLSIIFLLFMAERFVYMHEGLDFARPIVTYIFGIISLVSHLVGVIQWFSLTEAGWGDSCDEPPEDLDDRITFCITTGPAVAVFLIFMLSIVIPGSLFVYYKRDKEVTDRIIRLKPNNVFYIPIRAYYAVITILILISFVLSVASISTDKWVERNEIPDFEGDLFFCHDCDPETDNIGWDCYSAKICAKESDGLCESFFALKDAGQFYAILTGCFYFCLLFWL
jgi:hypothetical protein